jgi:hypothetical protein
MGGTFSRSWSLFKESLRVLNSDKELLLFPVLSAGVSLIAMVIVFAVGGAIMWTTPALRAGLQSMSASADDNVVGTMTYIAGLIVLFVFYLVGSFITTYFTGGLVGAALVRLRGGDPTFSDGMRLASQRLGGIFGYAVIQATVGVIISMLRGNGKSRGLVRGLVAGAAQTAWNIATFLAIPYLIDKGAGPIAAIKSSAAALKRTFGEQIVGSAGVGLILTIPIILIIVAAVVLSALLAANDAIALMIVVIVLAVLALALLGVLGSALNGIYRAAVYLYAEEGQVAEEFAEGAIRSAFQPAGA